MKLEIDTTKKTITILEETSVLEVLNFFKSLEAEDYKIISKKFNEPLIPLIPQRTEYILPETSFPPYNPYNPYRVTY